VPVTVTPVEKELPLSSLNLNGWPVLELSETSKIYSLPLIIVIAGLLTPSKTKTFTPPTLATVTV